MENVSMKELLNEYKALSSKVRSEEVNLKEMKRSFRASLPSLATGGMQDINKIIYPFFFSTEDIEVLGNSNISSFINITQDAGFVITRLARVVFQKITDSITGNVTYVYINPDKEELVEGLNFTVTDSQSTRVFHDKPMSINHIGSIKFPYHYRAKQYVSANNTLEVKFYNNSSKTYIPKLVFIGYRIRSENADNILNLIGGE